jgi:hypothetical protein
MTSSNRFAERPFSLRRIDVITGEPQLYCGSAPAPSLPVLAAVARLGRFIFSWWPANRALAGGQAPEPRQQILDSVKEGNASGREAA